MSIQDEVLPQSGTPHAPRTLCEAFQRTAAINPDAVALRTPGGTQTLTWNEYAEQVRLIAAGFSSLGVGHRDTVAMMMTNRLELFPLDVAAQHLGATSFSIYNTLAPQQIAHVLSNSGAKVICCEAQFVPRILASGVHLEHIVCVDKLAPHTLTVADVIAGGRPDFDFDAAWRAVQPDDVLTLVYTSGTTGDPKGVELTHRNITFQCEAITEVFDGVGPDDRMLSYLPTAHAADRVSALYLQQMTGTTVTVVPDLRQIGAALPDARPTIFAAVPRVWEKLKAAIEFAVSNEPDDARRAGLVQALDLATERGALALAGRDIPDELAAQWARADELVLSVLRTKIGLGNVRSALSGAAPIPPQTLAFIYGLGIPVAEAWGMSETSAVATASAGDQIRLGTVGRAIPGMECAVADDGELLARGPLIMKGYRHDPVRTAEAIDADGWLHTGDIATMDADGYIRIVDRKKDIIINAAGKNMSPVGIEHAIKEATPLAGVIAVIGDAQPYNTALIVLDAEVAGRYAAEHGLADEISTLATDPEVIARVAAGVAAGNAKLSRVEQIKRFTILPTYWEAGGDELTPTMKTKRKPISAKYAAEIDHLYADRPGPTVHEPSHTP